MIVDGCLEKIKTCEGCSFLKDDLTDEYYLLCDDENNHYPLEFKCIHIKKSTHFYNPSKNMIGRFDGKQYLVSLNGCALEFYEINSLVHHEEEYLEFPYWSKKSGKCTFKKCYQLIDSFKCEFTNYSAISICLISDMIAISNKMGQVLYFSFKDHKTPSRFDTMENNPIISMNYNSVYSILSVFYLNGKMIVYYLQDKIFLPHTSYMPELSSPISCYSINKKKLTYVFYHTDATISVYSLSILNDDKKMIKFSLLYKPFQLPLNNNPIISLSIDQRCKSIYYNTINSFGIITLSGDYIYNSDDNDIKINPKNGFFTNIMLVIFDNKNYIYKLKILHSYNDNICINNKIYLYSNDQFYKYNDEENIWSLHKISIYPFTTNIMPHSVYSLVAMFGNDTLILYDTLNKEYKKYYKKNGIFIDVKWWKNDWIIILTYNTTTQKYTLYSCHLFKKLAVLSSFSSPKHIHEYDDIRSNPNNNNIHIINQLFDYDFNEICASPKASTFANKIYKSPKMISSTLRKSFSFSSVKSPISSSSSASSTSATTKTPTPQLEREREREEGEKGRGESNNNNYYNNTNNIGGMYKYEFDSKSIPILIQFNNWLVIYSFSIGIQLYNISLVDNTPSLKLQYEYDNTNIPYYFTQLHICPTNTGFPYLLGIALDKNVYYSRIDTNEWINITDKVQKIFITCLSTDIIEIQWCVFIMKYNSDIEIWFPSLHSNDLELSFPKYNNQFRLISINPKNNCYIYISNNCHSIRNNISNNNIYFDFSIVEQSFVHHVSLHFLIKYECFFESYFSSYLYPMTESKLDVLQKIFSYIVLHYNSKEFNKKKENIEDISNSNNNNNSNKDNYISVYYLFQKLIQKYNVNSQICFQAARSMDSNYWNRIFIQPNYTLDILYNKSFELKAYKTCLIALPIYGVECTAITGKKIQKYHLNTIKFQENLKIFISNSKSLLFRRKSSLSSSTHSFHFSNDNKSPQNYFTNEPSQQQQQSILEQQNSSFTTNAYSNTNINFGSNTPNSSPTSTSSNYSPTTSSTSPYCVSNVVSDVITVIEKPFYIDIPCLSLEKAIELLLYSCLDMNIYNNNNNNKLIKHILDFINRELLRHCSCESLSKLDINPSDGLREIFNDIYIYLIKTNNFLYLYMLLSYIGTKVINLNSNNYLNEDDKKENNVEVFEMNAITITKILDDLLQQFEIHYDIEEKGKIISKVIIGPTDDVDDNEFNSKIGVKGKTKELNTLSNYFECMELYNYALLCYIILKDKIKVESLKDKCELVWNYMFRTK